MADWLGRNGHEPVLQRFPHACQYAPGLLRLTKAPKGTEAVLTNSWNGFAFHRKGLRSVCVEHLFVLDPELDPYKSFAQSTFHKFMVGRFIARSYRSADRVVAVSAYTAGQIRSRFPDVAAEVNLNGVDVDRFAPSAEAREDGPFRLLFAGNATIRKGADLLAPIMEQLGEQFELRLTASASDLPALAGRNNVHFLGRLSPQEMERELRYCDALLAPTRMEGP